MLVDSILGCGPWLDSQFGHKRYLSQHPRRFRIPTLHEDPPLELPFVWDMRVQPENLLMKCPGKP